MGITELAEIVRAGLDADEDVAIDLNRAAKLPERVPDFYGAGGPAAKYLWQRFNTARVLAEVAGKRALLDEALGWRHDVHDDSWFTCQAATDEHDGGTYAETDGGGPCDCGRDARVLAILTHLAQPYQESP